MQAYHLIASMKKLGYLEWQSNRNISIYTINVLCRIIKKQLVRYSRGVWQHHQGHTYHD